MKPGNISRGYPRVGDRIGVYRYLGVGDNEAVEGKIIEINGSAYSVRWDKGRPQESYLSAKSPLIAWIKSPDDTTRLTHRGE